MAATDGAPATTPYESAPAFDQHSNALQLPCVCTLIVVESRSGTGSGKG
eukprot:CAMPEP_0115886554 /NCGR_PEP_ID=MMETSP0287-20121206/31274_1 /TAXON_ID=412157 /ORGANISM="Chrysochromulina rotalis, Strain UIO044" /LENGTH=48 /DNA_ID= /DNA_START= /DNA_END= /DNA_ORIENTATION=